MARFLHSVHSFTVRKWDRVLLALFWTLGLAFGAVVFRYTGSILVSQMPLAVRCQPSIFGLLTSSFLPFLFSAISVYFGAPALLHGICFLKASLFFYVSCGVLSAYGSCGWLIRWLFLFSDGLSLILLLCYCLRHVSGVRGFSAGELAGCAVVLLLIAGVDNSVISPLLRRVLS